MTISYHSGRRLQGLSTDTVETATFQGNFTSNAGWTTTDSSNFSIDTANNELDFSVEGGTGAADRIYYDLGSVSDTAWVLRLSRVNFSTISTYMNIAFTLSDNISGYNTSQDALGCSFSDGGDPTDYLFPVKADNTGILTGSNILNGQFSTGVDYYIEIKRTSATNLSIALYTGGFNGTLITSGTSTIASTIVGLRYLKIMETQPDTPTGVKGVGSIKNISFWNGVSSVTSKPTNVQSGSRFEETDTRKIYYYDGTSWSVGI
jgi:hypothetical protein